MNDQTWVLCTIAMRRIWNEQPMGEHLLLDPHARRMELDEQVVAGRGGVVASDQPREPGELLAIDGATAGRESAVRGDVHVPRLDSRVDAPLEASQDQDAGTIEIAGMADRQAGSGAHAQQHYDRPARLSAREHDQLASRIGALDVVEERRLVLDHGDALGGELDERGIAQLRERQRSRIAEQCVSSDMVEADIAARVDERAEHVGQNAGGVAQQAADLERGGEGSRLRGGPHRGDVGLGRRIVGDQRLGEPARAVAAGEERLAVAEHARGEVRDPDRRGQLEQRVERADDVGDDRRGTGDLAAGGELPGLAGARLGGGTLVGEKRARDGVARRRKRRELAPQGVLVGGELGARIAGNAGESGVERSVELDTGGDGAREIDAGPRRRDRRNGARGEQRAQRGDDRGVSIDRDGPRQSAVALAAVEDRVESGARAGRGRDGGADRIDEVHEPDDIAAARQLIAADPAARRAAFESGLAPLLAHGLAGRVAAVLTAERSPWYLTILYALLLFRRDHELEPLHEDVFSQVAAAMQHLGDYDAALFAQDIEQLVRWAAIDRITEAHKLRNYRDNRRERYRYRLGSDTVALLEWLEARLAARLDGRVGDSRDRLADVVGNLRELKRVLDAWRDGARDGDAARRALYLLEAIGDAIDDVGTELLAFRGEMLAFASRPYELAALRAILAWLERYVGLYVRRIEELRADIETRFRELAAPRYKSALDECRTAVSEERAAAPRALRGATISVPADHSAAHAAFFAPTGMLAALCSRIDESARAVVLKMQRHLRELERRNARLADLRAAIRQIARGDEADARLADLVTGLVASAHGRFDRRASSAVERAAPPMPRGHTRATPASARKPIARKRDGIEAIRTLAQLRRAALGAWLAEVLDGRERAQLSACVVAGDETPRRWLDVARAQRLRGGKELAAIGFSIADAPGEAVIGDAVTGIAAPDCWIVRREPLPASNASDEQPRSSERRRS